MTILELLETTQQIPKIHQTKENVYQTTEGRKYGTDKNEDKQREWSVSTAYSWETKERNRRWNKFRFLEFGVYIFLMGRSDQCYRLAFRAVTKTERKKNKIQQRTLFGLPYLKDSEKNRWREM